MREFVERTGVGSEHPSWRYLWTDAFAVCNLLGLFRVTNDELYRDLALRLVDEVHRALGRFREDDARRGWISGLGEEEGRAHPTRGGLRIGKTLPERAPAEPFDEQAEWDRDGQYFHYLTRWMRALDLTAHATKNPRYNLWARELADTAHDAFVVHGPDRRMVWKMSTDLSRPLVASMGHHDPLDGFLTCHELRATATLFPSVETLPDLDEVARDFASLIELRELSTADPLGLGGLLTDICRLARLTATGALANQGLLDALLAATLEGLYDFSCKRSWEKPASRRLAFRELGLAIGLRAVDFIEEAADSMPPPSSKSAASRTRLESLSRFSFVGHELETFWLEPAHRTNETWTAHRDINEVMLATCLVPEGYLVPAPRQ